MLIYIYIHDHFYSTVVDNPAHMSQNMLRIFVEKRLGQLMLFAVECLFISELLTVCVPAFPNLHLVLDDTINVDPAATKITNL